MPNRSTFTDPKKAAVRLWEVSAPGAGTALGNVLATAIGPSAFPPVCCSPLLPEAGTVSVGDKFSAATPKATRVSGQSS